MSQQETTFEPATSRQLWALFCATKVDHRNAGLSKQQASEMIGALKKEGTKAKAVKRSEDKSNDKLFQQLYDKAHEAGMKAGKAVGVVPMVVGDGQRTYFVEDGACGFAWIVAGDGRSPFVKWLVKKGYGQRIWVHEFNQSIQRKEAYAYAFSEVLREAGIKSYSDSRLD